MLNHKIAVIHILTPALIVPTPIVTNDKEIIDYSHYTWSKVVAIVLLNCLTVLFDGFQFKTSCVGPTFLVEKVSTQS